MFEFVGNAMIYMEVMFGLIYKTNSIVLALLISQMTKFIEYACFFV